VGRFASAIQSYGPRDPTVLPAAEGIIPAMLAPTVLVDRRGPVTVLTLNRPEVRNCIDAETVARLAEAIEAVRLDRSPGSWW
jgi:hypothetical protein